MHLRRKGVNRGICNMALQLVAGVPTSGVRGIDYAP